MEPIKHDIIVSASPQRAYEAVATAGGIKGWWAKNSDIAEALGGHTVLRFTHAEMSATMEFDLTDLQPGRRVEWTSTKNTNPIWPGSKLVWEIEAAPSGSVVHFSHSGFSDGGPPYDMTVEGWGLYVQSLSDYLNGKAANPSD